MHFTPNSQAILYGTHIGIVQNMLDYDYLCGRWPSIAAVYSSVSSGKRYKVFFWDKEIFVPTIHTRDEVVQFPEVDTLINLASFRSCTAINTEAIASWHFQHIFTIAEWVAERETRELSALSKNSWVELFGPSIVWWLISGVFRIGHTGWSLDNILKSRLTTPGSIGIVTKSGWMMNELCRIVSKHSDGVHTAFQIGGDRYPMMSFLPIIEYFEAHPGIHMIVLLGEVGNPIELEIAKMIQSQKIKKPVVAYCIGTAAEHMQTEVQFWHAWAKANTEAETASHKNKVLTESWAYVPEDFGGYGEMIGKVWKEIENKTKN